MSAVPEVEIVEEWHRWDGFLSGIVRIDNDLYLCDCKTDPLDDGERQYIARSLFHLVAPLVSFHAPQFTLQDPGEKLFREAQIVNRQRRASA